ncbi:MAG TPA: ABC transporter ATP-binding protein [Candidatus Avipropionibacterium avicola]|uniref:ABC transporter ATP-binding protein n=1 Tax=Candidatus Avipropionibacterium avicola TaxID=2840701 RepID=A0A9D1KMR6_9ACTN|nr:ABC transporter ATP-binding protein [Candidatus Avipropionibacterium avicola]
MTTPPEPVEGPDPTPPEPVEEPTPPTTPEPVEGPEPVLEVAGLSVAFGRRPPSVSGISFAIAPGERVGLIGESGSGKSVTALAVMGLLPEYARTSGVVWLAGEQILDRPDAVLARLRGNQVSMVFQEPMTALDPTMKVGRQVAEVIGLHRRRAGSGHVRARVLETLGDVGLADPARIAGSYPHQLSGGQRQRVVIAMALVNTPDLVICDEPTTALDVTVQAKVLGLLDRELAAAGAGCLFISHDLAVVSQLCSRVLVMLDGRIVEDAPLDTILTAPEHPYTKGLVATARIDRVTPGERLPTVADFWDETSPEPTPPEPTSPEPTSPEPVEGS